VFTPDGHDKTFGELQFHEQAAFSHRRAAILKFLDAVAPADAAAPE
jgi:inosine triphosphate pyrophosphatase